MLGYRLGARDNLGSDFRVQPQRFGILLQEAAVEKVAWKDAHLIRFKSFQVAHTYAGLSGEIGNTAITLQPLLAEQFSCGRHRNEVLRASNRYNTTFGAR